VTWSDRLLIWLNPRLYEWRVNNALMRKWRRECERARTHGYPPPVPPEKVRVK
jgi:hypothetical protein